MPKEIIKIKNADGRIIEAEGEEILILNDGAVVFKLDRPIEVEVNKGQVDRLTVITKEAGVEDFVYDLRQVSIEEQVREKKEKRRLV